MEINTPYKFPEMEELRKAIQDEYSQVANEPGKGFHFHTGRTLARILEYQEDWLAGIPDETIGSFAGTGNPFQAGEILPGDRVIDLGCGAGLDSMIAAKMCGPDGQVIGVDMTPAMLIKASSSAEKAGIDNVYFKKGYAEDLPIVDNWADVLISNGVLNLAPDKSVVLGEAARVLRSGGRLLIGDILVQKPLPRSAKRDISLWTG